MTPLRPPSHLHNSCTGPGDSAEIIRAVQHSAAVAHASQSDLLPTVIARLDLLEDEETLRWLRFPHGTPAQRSGDLARLG